MLFVKKETPKNESRVILFSFLSSRGTQSSVSSQIGFHVNSQKTKSHYANSATELFKWKEKTRKVYNWICTQNGQWNFLFTTCVAVIVCIVSYTFSPFSLPRCRVFRFGQMPPVSQKRSKQTKTKKHDTNKNLAVTHRGLLNGEIFFVSFWFMTVNSTHSFGKLLKWKKQKVCARVCDAFVQNNHLEIMLIWNDQTKSNPFFFSLNPIH